MALISWDDEEDKKDDSGIQRVASVQSNWQPAASGANTSVATNDVTTTNPGGIFSQTPNQSQGASSYLLSDEKAQADEARRKRDAQIAEARRQAAARAALIAQQQQTKQATRDAWQKTQTQVTPVVDPNVERQKRIQELEAQLKQENQGVGGFFNNFVRDRFDANSTRDRLNRLKAEQPEMFQEQQKYTARDNVQSVATNPFKRVFEEFTEAPRRIGYGLAQNTSTADDAREAMLSLQQTQNDAILKAQRKIQDPTISEEERLRWYNWLVKAAPEIAQSQYENNLQMKKNYNDADPVAGTAAIAEMALDVLTAGLGGRIAAQTAKLGAKGVRGARYLEPVLSGAASGGVGAVTSQGSDVTPAQIGTGAIAGAGLGGLTAFGGSLAGRGARRLMPESFPGGRAVDGTFVPELTPVRTDPSVRAVVPDVGDTPRIDTGNITLPEDSTPIKASDIPEVIPSRESSRRLYEVDDTPLTPGERRALAELEGNRLNEDYTAATRELRQLADEAGQPELYTKVMKVVSEQNMTQAEALEYIRKGLADMRDSGTNAKIRAVQQAEAPVADGAAKTPVVPTEQIKTLQDAIPGKSQAEEAQIRQRIQQVDQGEPVIKKRKIHPDDQGTMRDFIDYQRGIYKLDPKKVKDAKAIQDLELEASRIAEYYGLKMPKTAKGLADVFDQRLMEDGFGKPQKELTGAAKQAQMARDGDAGSGGFMPEKSSGRKETLTWEDPRRTVKNDGWESYRENSIKNYEEYIAYEESRGAAEYHIRGLKENLKALKSANPNEVYRINPATGKVEVHPSSELVKAFSDYIGEDAPPIVIGNVLEPGSASRIPSNWAGANATYSAPLSRLDYKGKNSVYHETMHHLDHFVRGYEGSNPKMMELRQLRDAIPVEEMRAFKVVEGRAKNKAEYVAHAMDALLDGRIKAGELGVATMRYIKKFFSSVTEAFTSGFGKNRDGVKIADYVKRLDAIINDGKAPKQKPLTPGELKPAKGNLPPSMGGGTKIPVTGGNSPTPKVKKTPTPKERFAQRMMMKTGSMTEIKKRIAEAVGLGKDTELEIDDLLKEGKISTKQADKVRKIYNELESIYERNAKIQRQNRSNYKNNRAVDENINKQRNRDTRREGELQQQLETQLKKIQRQGNFGERATQSLENVTAGRLANMLTSTGNVSRNLFQEIGADFISVLKNPVATIRGATKNGNLLKAEGQRSIGGWKNTPTSVSEGYKYILGNAYKTAMTPVSAGQRARVGAMRTELTKWAMKEIEGRDLTNAQAESLSRTLGNYTEAMANTLAGVDNGMVSSRHAMQTLKAWKKFVQTGETSDLLKFESLVERQSTLASKMMKGVFEGETKKGRVVNALLSNVFPYVRTAWNLASTGVTRNLNPISKSVIDQIRADQLGKGTNTVNILKNKLVDYGLLTGAAMLVNDKVIVYNDGDEVDQPRGISIRIPGSDKYIPVRATPIELPLAVTVAAARIAEDVMSGDVRDPSYYGKIISGSVPYVDAFNQTTGVAESVGALMGEDSGDGGYAAKAYGVNTAKSLVPWSNNGIEPQLDAIRGQSTPARTAYDKNVLNWFGNTLNNSYGRGDYLPVSRDAAGRARTKDNQGVIINKTISDAPTAEFNDAVSNLVEYGRQNGLGKATEDMFNTYDTGKNNNFKSIQDSITWLDVPEGEKPDNAKKLEKNAKYTDLSRQIRDAFYGGGDASALLTLDGKNLYSDVSVPNKNGTKNSTLPISMQSITNAIAATDLPAEQRDRMYEISQANTALYERFQNDELTYDQYSALKAQNEEEYTSILSNSEGYQQLAALMDELESTGFFDADGLGSTRAGQTYLWNALNSMLGSKGKTPAANYPESDNGFSSWGRGGGSGIGASNKPGDRGSQSIKWTPVGRRQMAAVKKGTYTPFKATVRLGNEVKKDRTQNYESRSF